MLQKTDSTTAPPEIPTIGFQSASAGRAVGKPRLASLAIGVGLVVLAALLALWFSGAGTRWAGTPGSSGESTEVAAGQATDASSLPVDAALSGESDPAPLLASDSNLDAGPIDGPAPDTIMPFAELGAVPQADAAVDAPGTAIEPLLAAAPPLPEPAAPESGLPTVGPATEPGGLELAALAAIAQPGAAISAAEADRFYAATGVWLRAPRLPLLPRTETLDTFGPPGLTASAGLSGAVPLLPSVGPDPGLPRQSDPPPPGTSYLRDARGNILATPEGTLLPSGIVVFAAAPPLDPPTRPGTIAPAPETVIDPAAVPDPAPDLAAAAAGADVSVPLPAVQPLAAAPSTGPVLRPDSVLARAAALADVPPESGPPEAAVQGVVPPEIGSAEAVIGLDALATAQTGNEAPPGGVALDGLRPPGRPAALVAETLVQTDFDGPRPPLRPADLAPDLPPPPADPVQDPLPAPLPAGQTPIVAPGPTDVTEALVAIVALAPDPLRDATAQAVAVARRPDARPVNFDRVVTRAQNRIARAQPASAPEAAPGTGAGGVGTGALETEEQAESEPEIASAAAAAPSGPIPGGVADAATLENAIALREINLIGVYGRPDDRRALIRLANGRYLRVSVGDNLDGGRVAAIGNDSLNYTRSGRTITLQIPNG